MFVTKPFWVIDSHIHQKMQLEAPLKMLCLMWAYIKYKYGNSPHLDKFNEAFNNIYTSHIIKALSQLFFLLWGVIRSPVLSSDEL